MTCTIILLLPSAAGGHVPCRDPGCGVKVIWHALYRVAGLWRVSGWSWCDDHRPRPSGA